MGIYLSNVININSDSVATGGGLIWKVVSESTLGVDGNGYIFDTSSGSLTLTLPAIPSEGDQVGIKDISNNFTNNNLVISGNGNNIQGSSDNLSMDLSGYGGVFIYTNSTTGWVLFSDYDETYEFKNENIQSHVSSTSNPHTVTKDQVGLGNVDNTSDANKPVSTATQTALNLKANLASPALTGVPTAPTASQSDNTTQIATTAYVKSQNYVTSSGVTSVSGGDGLTGTITTTGSLAVDATVVRTVGNQTIAGSKWFTSQIVNTTAWNSNAGQIYLGGDTGNMIQWSGQGVDLPTTTTRSAGTKLLLNGNLSSTNVDYAIGIASLTFWNSIPASDRKFQWYASTSPIMTLLGTGSLGLGTVTPSEKLDVVGKVKASTGFTTGNFDIVYNATTESLDFNFIG